MRPEHYYKHRILCIEGSIMLQIDSSEASKVAVNKKEYTETIVTFLFFLFDYTFQSLHVYL